MRKSVAFSNESSSPCDWVGVSYDDNRRVSKIAIGGLVSNGFQRSQLGVWLAMALCPPLSEASSARHANLLRSHLQNPQRLVSANRFTSIAPILFNSKPSLSGLLSVSLDKNNLPKAWKIP
ncbi:unnamed protein product [Cuscuta europaea]|uniref:Uncharacterized protein n=1 Tax=Cuscuta europaea TaxID=41803 RepID=A0A9P0ZXU1_CUSEU|nr:unnamed protein product [Cuscuta europaea]